MFESTNVTSGKTRPTASTSEPKNDAAPVWAYATSPAIGTVMVRVAMAIAKYVDRAIGVRLRRVFNMARTLLSRLDGRAIAGAGKALVVCCLKARASASR